MSAADLSGDSRELSALAGQLPAALSAAESRVLLEAAHTYGATRAAMTDPAAADPRTWRTPLRLLVLDGTRPEDAVRRDYDNWTHWIAGGGLLAIHGVSAAPAADRSYGRAVDSGKFRELPGIDSLRILQRTAACG
ncbi:hypothetical protein [Nocardia inohanensis]|uniref:hypothetical protein n=1 Tax=Nocardia inohanensis TaxID=209246 RepID=UPI00082D0653|nr:hypothetical protein [Nocardia inohanensis]